MDFTIALLLQWRQVQHAIRDDDIERPILEWNVLGWAEGDFGAGQTDPAKVGPRLLDHFRSEVEAADTHVSQGVTSGTQPDLLTQLGAAIGALYDATVELGIASQVTTFTLSDFSRTLIPAGSAGAAGSDHAWGSHHFVIGDAVAGRDFYGTFPTLAPHGPNDSDSGANARGRFIPTIAVDQYAATLALWFGVSPGDLPTVLPNIGRFATPNLGFLLG